jgi:hypothetical protein
MLESEDNYNAIDRVTARKMFLCAKSLKREMEENRNAINRFRMEFVFR